ncbi:MAG TPA: class I SAM-dependent methyltransferase [Myxococcales bacterium]|nr:class I SAM-dependent methyltransferase [Myxococcales bacterium]
MQTTAKQKGYKGLPMEGVIATWYAHITEGDARAYRACAAAVAGRLRPGAGVLEVAPGPGYLAIELARLGDFRVTGLDISHSFVRIAGENARKAGVSIDFRQGNASRMPFEDGTFDAIVCRAAFKNFSDPAGALKEMHRVLRPGGVASVFDLRRDAPRDAVDAHVEEMGLSGLNTALTKLTFRFMLLRTAYPRAAMEQMAAQTPFGAWELLDDGIGFELQLVK